MGACELCIFLPTLKDLCGFLPSLGNNGIGPDGWYTATAAAPRSTFGPFRV